MEKNNENLMVEDNHTYTATELVVSAIWADILQCSEISPTDNFLELGGDSMLMMMALFRVGEELGLELPPSMLLESPTLEEFCRTVDDIRDAQSQRSNTVAHGAPMQLEEGNL